MTVTIERASNRPRLYFLHVPKTAGTSLTAALDSFFEAGEICPWHDLSQVLREPRERLRRYRFFRGHHGMYLPRMLDERPLIVTLLRDPLSRSISHYLDIAARPTHRLHGEAVASDLEGFVHSESGEAELLNFQCRYLALDDVERDYLGHNRLVERGRDAIRAKYAAPSLLARAIENLASTDIVGVSECADDAARAVAELLGRPPPDRLARLNRAGASFDPRSLTAAALRRLLELTELDRRLYTHALARALAPRRDRSQRPAAPTPSYLPT